MNTPLVDLASALAWSPQANLGPEQATTLSRCIAAASASICRRTRRTWATANYVAAHSGTRAAGPQLQLQDPATRLVTAPVTSVTSVSESGRVIPAVLLPTLPSTDGDYAIVSPAGTATRVVVRGSVSNPVPWALGFANIAISYTAGYCVDGSDETLPALPEDLRQVVIEAAWQMYREGSRTGLESVQDQSANLRFDRFLSPTAKQVLESYTLPIVRVPTLEA